MLTRLWHARGHRRYLDEVVGYGLAAFGFAFQFFNGFTLPFPFNIIFFPLTLVEWWIRWSITSGTTVPGLPV